MIQAIDTVGDGWWGGALYTVIVNGETVIHEEMNSTSSTRQSTVFSVALPASARIAFSENKASRGGGGAVFWEDTPPEFLEDYRNESDSNTALYGDFAATPARTLSAMNQTYDAISGISMTKDPISVELKDR
jgi:hypothetical protein